MQTYQGYIKDGLVVPINMPQSQNGVRVVITLPDTSASRPDTELADAVKARRYEKKYLRYVGALSDEDRLELETILRDTERVDADEW